jgi:PAS domain-containing protein
VKTSELIKLTKDKFMQLVLLGIDKRNSNLYYMYANFNKYVLNSNDQYQEYMFKMKQIQSMNKTLQDNNYKEQLNQDVDKSGFLLVRGTYHDFGKIIYANRQMCHMLGYTPEQLNTSGKTINVLMPQIISERHSAFLSVFRETGIPVFIQQIQ